jgi:23S rRNA pseudouridine2605 synthase
MAKKKSTKLQSQSTEPESAEPRFEAASETIIPKIEDPAGDETDGEAKTANEAGTKSETETEIEAETEPEFTSQPRPPSKLERLQKILAAAGVASRRGAEAMIEQGRVQVNGKIVTVLGTKADAARDHIRVDGKLLQGPERHRYFVLNKPRGFVTTVKDPEGRRTVMQFFSKFSERLYPVGRLDYMSEGLLVVTNDGELANRLTKASSGVEKTYLVKVAGQPTEAELNILRGGVSIERGKPGSPQVRTSPARIRQVRQGDNPWYEVVLIEGRNRELRKMFEEVGHFVEKIRRVGYGPLVLDQEPGSLRELQLAEVDALRRAAEGTLRTPKSKDLRRRNLLDAGLLPTVLPKPSNRPRAAKPTDRFTLASDHPANFRLKNFEAGRPSEFRPKKFGSDRERTNRTDRTSRPAGSFASGAANKLFRPARPAGSFDKNAAKPFRLASPSGEDRPFSAKPAWKKPQPPARSTGEEVRPAAGRSFDRLSARPAFRSGSGHSSSSSRSFTPRTEGAAEFRPAKAKPFSASRAERKAGSGWKPRPSGAGKPVFGSRSRPKSGAPSDRSSSVGWKSGYKAKPGGTKRTGSRPGGNRPGGKKRS